MQDALSAIRLAFDERSATYDDGAFHRDLARRVAEFADLAAVHAVLDVATGTGLVLRHLAERAPRLDLAGTDISRGMLAQAAVNLPSGTWIEADAASLPLPDASVDLITCVTALHIIPDVTSAVAEWRRVLRPAGRVVTATFLRESRQPGPAKYRSFGVDHESFDAVDTLTATFARWRFGVLRHVEWRQDDMAMLIAELAPARRRGLQD